MDIQVGQKYVSKDGNCIAEVVRLTDATVYLRTGDQESWENPRYLRLTTFEKKFEPLVEHSDLDVLSTESADAANCTGTTTGRISCSEPNMSEVNGPSISNPLPSILEMDMSEAELRILAAFDPKAIWEEEATSKFFRFKGLKCLILRGPLGALCGYVQLPQGPLKDKAKKFGRGLVFPNKKYFVLRKVHRTPEYDLPALRSLEVHGGLTFSGNPRHHRAERGLWVGFDCAHCDDLVPMLYNLFPTVEGSKMVHSGSYRDMEYVTQQCESLAEQIIRLNCKMVRK